MTRHSFGASGLLLLLGAASAGAHEIRPAYLELTETAPGRVEMVWKQPAAGEAVIDLRPRFPESWRQIEPPRVTKTPEARTLQAVYNPGGPLAGQTISIDGLSSSPTDTLLRVHLRDGTLLTVILKPDSPAYTMPANAKPSIAAAARVKREIVSDFYLALSIRAARSGGLTALLAIKPRSPARGVTLGVHVRHNDHRFAVDAKKEPVRKASRHQSASRIAVQHGERFRVNQYEIHG